MTGGRLRLTAALLAPLVVALGALPVCAQSVSMSGLIGNKAVLIIDNASPRLLGPGESRGLVKVISVGNEQAVLEINGQRATLRVGDTPVSIESAPAPRSGSARAGSGGGSSAAGSKIVIPMGSGGHFFVNGAINGGSMQFIVDTGATTIAMGVSDAVRLGIDYKRGQPVQMGTANGIAQGWKVRLQAVRVGDVELYDLEAIVGPNMPFALLGNSFLNRFQMNRGIGEMVLTRLY